MASLSAFCSGFPCVHLFSMSALPHCRQWVGSIGVSSCWGMDFCQPQAWQMVCRLLLSMGAPDAGTWVQFNGYSAAMSDDNHLPGCETLTLAQVAALPAADTLILTVNNRLARRLVQELAT